MKASHTIRNREEKENKLRFVLRKLMLEAGLTEGQLARALSIPGTTLNKLLNAETLSPKVETLVPIAKYFQISIEQLIGEKPFFAKEAPAKATLQKDEHELDLELYIKCLDATCKIMKAKKYKISAEQTLEIIKEIYFYFLLKETKEVDVRFIEWFLTRSLA
jgi:transcriptional regulator with XRE-family HTH domain